jgi:hypothetical protein
MDKIEGQALEREFFTPSFYYLNTDVPILGQFTDGASPDNVTGVGLERSRLPTISGERKT